MISKSDCPRPIPTHCPFCNNKLKQITDWEYFSLFCERLECQDDFTFELEDNGGCLTIRYKYQQGTMAIAFWEHRYEYDENVYGYGTVKNNDRIIRELTGYIDFEEVKRIFSYNILG